VVLSRDELIAFSGATGGDIVVAARPGTDIGQVRERVAAALGDGFDVVDGDALRQQNAVDSTKYVGSFLKMLRAATDPAQLPGATRWRYWLTGAAVAGCGALGALVAWSGVGQGFDGLPRMAASGMIIFARSCSSYRWPSPRSAPAAPARPRRRPAGPGGGGQRAAHPVRFAATTAAVVSVSFP
jgi:hypothetical protein